MSSEPEPQIKIVSEEAGKVSTEALPEKSVSRKRKYTAEEEEDLENVVVKIPRSTTIISDPSGLEPFVDKLLLEEDETRFQELGPTETVKKMLAQTYQVLEGGIFLKKYAENCQRRIRELEKSNTSLRKELAGSKVETKEASDSLKETQARLKETQLSLKQTDAILQLERETYGVELDSYKEALSRVEEEKKVMSDEMDDIAYGAMMRERGRLMKQYLAGEHVEWTPEKWVRYLQKLDAGEDPSSGEDEEEKEGGNFPLEENVESAEAIVEPPTVEQGKEAADQVEVPELVEAEAAAQD